MFKNHEIMNYYEEKLPNSMEILIKLRKDIEFNLN